MKEELLKGLSEEQIAKLKECKNQEEMLAVAKEEGVELSDEQLQAVSGGCSSAAPTRCYKCGSGNIRQSGTVRVDGETHKSFTCNACGFVWAPCEW